MTEADEGVDDPRSYGVRRGLIARTIYQVLAAGGGPMRGGDVLAQVAETVELNDRELSTNASGQPRWRTAANVALSWSTFGGWLERDENRGYVLTESGAEALDELTGEDLWLEISRRYQASRREGESQGVGWDPFLRWARELTSVIDLDTEERDYKLKAAEKWAAAGVACAANSKDWAERLKQASGAGNLIDSFAQPGCATASSIIPTRCARPSGSCTPRAPWRRSRSSASSSAVGLSTSVPGIALCSPPASCSAATRRRSLRIDPR